MTADGSRPDHSDARPQVSVFVHDFIPLDVDFNAASAALLRVLDAEHMAVTVAGACNREGAGSRDHLGSRALRPEEVAVTIGRIRWREDAVVVPIGWLPEPIDAGVPLEADLEVAEYGDRRCHLHLLGRARLRPEMQPATREASLYGRLAVAVVRHVLDELALDVTAGVEAARLSPPTSRLRPGHRPDP